MREGIWKPGQVGEFEDGTVGGESREKAKVLREESREMLRDFSRAGENLTLPAAKRCELFYVLVGEFAATRAVRVKKGRFLRFDDATNLPRGQSARAWIVSFCPESGNTARVWNVL